jgi:uncharacterized protein
MTRFFQVQLRTLDVDTARAFYRSVLGWDPANAVPLHEQAIARGARPHWLGFLDVGDVDRKAASFAERGAIALGPKWVNPEGLEAAVMRDPGGAVVALAKPPAEATKARAPTPDVAWYLLHTPDVARARVNYAELFGWEFGAPQDLGPHGVFHPFAWEPGGARVGSLTDTSARAGVHPYWLFHFRLAAAALDPAMETIRAAGGVVVESVVLPTGERVAVCDDPQGAAFALYAGSSAHA